MVLELRGKVKPYVRMTQRGKYVKANALEYLAWKDDAGYQFKQQMRLRELEPLPDKTPLTAWLAFWIPNRIHGFDLDNAVKAVFDAAQGVVFKDDRYVDEIHASRCKTSEYIRTMFGEYHTVITFDERLAIATVNSGRALATLERALDGKGEK